MSPLLPLPFPPLPPKFPLIPHSKVPIWYPSPSFTSHARSLLTTPTITTQTLVSWAYTAQPPATAATRSVSGRYHYYIGIARWRDSHTHIHNLTPALTTPIRVLTPTILEPPCASHVSHRGAGQSAERNCGSPCSALDHLARTSGQRRDTVKWARRNPPAHARLNPPVAFLSCQSAIHPLPSPPPTHRNSTAAGKAFTCPALPVLHGSALGHPLFYRVCMYVHDCPLSFSPTQSPCIAACSLQRSDPIRRGPGP